MALKVGITVTIKINFTVWYVTEAAGFSALLILNVTEMAVTFNPLIKKSWGDSLEDT